MSCPRFGPRHQTRTAAARGTAGNNNTTSCSAVIRSPPARRRFVEWFTDAGRREQGARLEGRGGFPPRAPSPNPVLARRSHEQRDAGGGRATGRRRGGRLVRRGGKAAGVR